MDNFNFFDPQSLNALVTLLVGSFAIFLYSKQKKDHKKDAASLILQEIRYAEQLIRNSSEDFVYGLAAELLPTNSWNDNIHLFLNDLEDTEIDLISRFYSKAAYLDILIGKISDSKNQPQKPIIINQNLNPAQPQQPINIPIMNDLMIITQELIRQTTISVEYVYNTPTGEKLKNISKKKFLFFF